MKAIPFILAFVFNGLLAMDSQAQERPQQCSAAFVDNRMLVDEYTTKGKCRLPATTTGTLAVYTVALSPAQNQAVAPVGFRIAIRDKDSGTLTLYSKKSYRRVPVQAVMAKCQKGDHIVLLTEGNRYALPHNEILVQ